MIKQFKHICKTPQYFCRIVVWDSWLLPLKGDCRNVTWMLRFSHTQAGFIVPTGISFHGCSPNFLIVIQPRIRWIEPEPCRSSFSRIFNIFCQSTLKYSVLRKSTLKVISEDKNLAIIKVEDCKNSLWLVRFWEVDKLSCMVSKDETRKANQIQSVISFSTFF